MPVASASAAASLAAYEVGAAYERSLTDADRKQGAHYTPPAAAAGLVERALQWCSDAAPRVADLTCGGGAFLIAAADALFARGVPPEVVVNDLLVGVDVDPGAVAAATAALRLWADQHGVHSCSPQVMVGDMWQIQSRDLPGLCSLVVGNPPFQSQLASETARSAAVRAELGARFGAAAHRYVDSALLAACVAVDCVAPGGVVAVILPRSTVSSVDGSSARDWIAQRCDLVGAWVPEQRVFTAAVDVWAPVWTHRNGSMPATGSVRRYSGSAAEHDEGALATPGPQQWATLLTDGPGDVTWSGEGVIGDLALVTAGFRDEYYGLLEATVDGSADGLAVVTSGSIDPAVCSWGREPVRFGRRTWTSPRVQVDHITSPRAAAWAARLVAPKVLVASQTRVVEAVADLDGSMIGVTPVVSVVPEDPRLVDPLVTLLCSPLPSWWLFQRRAGSGMSPSAIRVSARDVAEVPLPASRTVWDAAHDLRLAGGSWRDVGALMLEAYAVSDPTLLEWWLARLPDTSARRSEQLARLPDTSARRSEQPARRSEKPD